MGIIMWFFIKGKLRWAGHARRMNDSSIPKYLMYDLFTKPEVLKG